MNKNLEEHLKTIFTNVNDWLKFAESKNAILIAADGAAALAALTILASNLSNLTNLTFVYLHLFILFILLSACASLFSIIPNTTLFFSSMNEKTDVANDNLLFYGHIAKYTPLDYILALKQRFKSENKEVDGLELDYAQQIVINSRITRRKNDIFRLAGWLAVTAIITPVLSIIIFLIIKRSQKLMIEKPTVEMDETEEVISKKEAIKFLNISKIKFDELVNSGRLESLNSNSKPQTKISDKIDEKPEEDNAVFDLGILKELKAELDTKK